MSTPEYTIICIRICTLRGRDLNIKWVVLNLIRSQFYPRKMKDELQHNVNTSVIARPNHDRRGERHWERERDRNQGNTRVNGQAFTQCRAPVSCPCLSPLTTGTWDSFKNCILTTTLVSCKTCLPFNTSGCFILSFHSTVIWVSSSDRDSYSCVLSYIGKWGKFKKSNISALTGADKVTLSISKTSVGPLRLFKWRI